MLRAGSNGLSPTSAISSSSAHPDFISPEAVDQVFDYASFMWDTADLWQQQNLSPTAYAQLDVNDSLGSTDLGGPASQINCTQLVPSISAVSQFSDSTRDLPSSHTSRSVDTVDFPPYRMRLVSENKPIEDHFLLEYFIRTPVPPILAQVETVHKWSTIRQLLIAMCNASAMVRYAIMAFAELLLRRQEGSWVHGAQNHYDKAVSELSNSAEMADITRHSKHRENLLATLFFLSYVDILESRVEMAHKNLKLAYALYKQGNKGEFRAVEIRLLSWLRLLDARAVSAGGDGFFLSDHDEALLVEASPSSLADEPDEHLEENTEGELEDLLFQMLYQPGIIFFQKVQSFMGRISKIDPWHRSRGTVDDETEVMNIAARISKDLKTLYESRPPLMDYAVSGKLTSAHVSPHLAATITRVFRTYLSNFYASRVHLHRVAYKALPLSGETSEALAAIKNLTKLMVNFQEDVEALPVNMLWPLLMLGSEEQNLDEREWIKLQIMCMEKVATFSAGTSCECLPPRVEKYTPRPPSVISTVSAPKS
jgi:hypothetical protein